MYIENPRVRGILWFLGSCFCFAAMASAIKHVGNLGSNPLMLVFLRNLLGTAMLLAVYWAYRDKLTMHLNNRLFYFWRCILGFVGMIFLFWSMSLLPVTNFVALSFTIPILSSLGAVVFLKERMGVHRWSAIIVGLIGALIIIKPGYIDIGLGVYVCLIFCTITATVLLMIKKLSALENIFSIMFYMHLWMTYFSIPFLPFYWETPSFPIIYWSAFIALLSIFAHYTLTNSLKLVDLTVTTPFDFSRILMASIIAYVFLNEVPETTSYIGAFVIVISATYIAHRERLKGKTLPKIS